MGFNNGPKLVTQGLDLLIDAADPGSYPGTGTVWTDLRSGVTGSLTGSVSYTSEYYGGLTFSNSSSAVIFPGTTANYGSGSFTVEMAFKPTYINGKHYLMSKNSGSFPNWAIYLSGSNGSGKLWSEWNIDASVSCSVSSSTTFETGSVYQVDVRILPGISASAIYVNGQSEGGAFGNSGGSLTTTGSLFLGNITQDNVENFSGSIYTVKTYLGINLNQPPVNFNATSTRFSKQLLPSTARRQFEYLIVAGGGGGSYTIGGGGGAGGLLTGTTYLNNSINQIIVGNGGAGGGGSINGYNGGNSVLESIVAFGGGGAGGNGARTGSNGGSGGGSISDYGSGIPGSGIPGQGNDGSGGPSGTKGGGGGAGSASISATGGSGSYVAPFAAIGGSPAGWFAGGGAGASYTTNFLGGIGGGGTGSRSGAGHTSGIPNTGGGGGGGWTSAGGAGGSGIVAVRYSGPLAGLGGEITQSAGYTYHVFRTVGTSSFTIF